MERSHTIEAISDVVYDLRHAHGFTQAELAKLSNVSRQTVASIESNPKDMKISSLEPILQSLGMELVCRPIMGRTAKPGAYTSIPT